jgi:hypothetical protein
MVSANADCRRRGHGKPPPAAISKFQREGQSRFRDPLPCADFSTARLRPAMGARTSRDPDLGHRGQSATLREASRSQHSHPGVGSHRLSDATRRRVESPSSTASPFWRVPGLVSQGCRRRLPGPHRHARNSGTTTLSIWRCISSDTPRVEGVGLFNIGPLELRCRA